jgi:hypothetical protein
MAAPHPAGYTGLITHTVGIDRRPWLGTRRSSYAPTRITMAPAPGKSGAGALGQSR